MNHPTFQNVGALIHTNELQARIFDMRCALFTAIRDTYKREPETVKSRLALTDEGAEHINRARMTKFGFEELMAMALHLGLDVVFVVKAN